ncbi:MAG: hypothetical protein AAFV29_15520, partial [Myxococcota bacterium]
MDNQDLAAFGAVAARVAGECEDVVPASNAVELAWPELAQAFHIQTERLDSLPSGLKPGVPTRVEVIDSAVTHRGDGEPGRGCLAHGRAMGLIVRDLACPASGASCRASVASTLALPLVAKADGTLQRDTENGGFFGTTLDLARAVEDAVSAWRSDASPQPRVISLSLGWASKHGGEYVQDAGDLPESIRPVWEAIAKARCYGAAVIAPTG